MNRLPIILLSAFAVCPAPAQQSFYQGLRSNNASMADVQPTWMGPLMQSDGRLGQAVRISVSNASFSGIRALSYGNGKGVSIIAERRFQVDLDPPAFFRNHTSSLKDGFGNAATQVKFRMASGNAAHGNFAVTAVLYHAFVQGIDQNRLLTSYNCPSIAFGKAFGRFALLQTVGGFLPTSKIAEQGRAIDWNVTAQFHLIPHSWVDLENNASFFHAGPFDGKTQNFLTPAAFYMVRRKQWKPEHASVVFACGMQIATSSTYYYNHNLITEMRILY